MCRVLVLASKSSCGIPSHCLKAPLGCTVHLAVEVWDVCFMPVSSQLVRIFSHAQWRLLCQSHEREVSQLHKKISLGLRHGFFELRPCLTLSHPPTFELPRRLCCHLAIVTRKSGQNHSICNLYSTHHEIKNTPLVLLVFLWRYVSHCNSHNF